MTRFSFLKQSLFACTLALFPIAAQANQDLPDRAVISIPSPRTATLLQLRGMGGRGTALLRVNNTCYQMPVRFVAGDFDGQSLQLYRNTPILLELRNAALVRALLRGVDIVSDTAKVSATPTDTTAEIMVHTGIAPTTGFVVNPGRSLSADLFGAAASPSNCAALEHWLGQSDAR